MPDKPARRRRSLRNQKVRVRTPIAPPIRTVCDQGPSADDVVERRAGCTADAAVEGARRPDGHLVLWDRRRANIDWTGSLEAAAGSTQLKLPMTNPLHSINWQGSALTAAMTATTSDWDASAGRILPSTQEPAIRSLNE